MPRITHWKGYRNSRWEKLPASSRGCLDPDTCWRTAETTVKSPVDFRTSKSEIWRTSQIQWIHVVWQSPWVWEWELDIQTGATPACLWSQAVGTDRELVLERNELSLNGWLSFGDEVRSSGCENYTNTEDAVSLMLLQASVLNPQLYGLKSQNGSQSICGYYSNFTCSWKPVGSSSPL